MTDPRYRQRWRVRARRTRSDLSQAAVAKVLELYLWESGERSDKATSLARQLKDRVSRALAGSTLSAETLEWLIAAFDMDEVDQNRLWEVFSGRKDPGSGISHTLRRRREMIRRQRHRTVSLVERYTVDASGSLAGRHTLHTIRAVEDGVDIYIFNHEPQASRIEVAHGGNLGLSYEYGGGLSSVEIVLERALRKSEATMLEYRTYFAPGAIFLTEVRRAAFARAENIDLAVEFAGATPQDAWWCVWDDHIGGARVQEQHVVLRNGTIRRFVPFIEEAVVGFRWEWH